jgi:hypothetical protein
MAGFFMIKESIINKKILTKYNVMPSINVNISASYHDRQNHSIDLMSEPKHIRNTISDYTIDITMDLNEKSSLPIKLIAERGLQIGDLLIYTASPTNLCFKQSNGEFTNHTLGETPLTLESERRFPINTEKDLLWCFEKRTYAVNLIK